MSTAAQRPRILLIESSENIREVMRIVLEDEGYHVSVDRSLPDPAHLVELAPDVIVQDVRPSGEPGGGWTSLALGSFDPILARVPRVLCSTATAELQDPATTERLDQMGIRVVLKPFRHKEFLTAVADALTARNMRDQDRVMQDA